MLTFDLEEIVNADDLHGKVLNDSTLIKKMLSEKVENASSDQRGAKYYDEEQLMSIINDSKSGIDHHLTKLDSRLKMQDKDPMWKYDMLKLKKYIVKRIYSKTDNQPSFWQMLDKTSFSGMRSYNDTFMASDDAYFEELEHDIKKGINAHYGCDNFDFCDKIHKTYNYLQDSINCLAHSVRHLYQFKGIDFFTEDYCKQVCAELDRIKNALNSANRYSSNVFEIFFQIVHAQRLIGLLNSQIYTNEYLFKNIIKKYNIQIPQDAVNKFDCYTRKISKYDADKYAYPIDTPLMPQGTVNAFDCYMRKISKSDANKYATPIDTALNFLFADPRDLVKLYTHNEDDADEATVLDAGKYVEKHVDDILDLVFAGSAEPLENRKTLLLKNCANITRVYKFATLETRHSRHDKYITPPAPVKVIIAICRALVVKEQPSDGTYADKPLMKQTFSATGYTPFSNSNSKKILIVRDAKNYEHNKQIKEQNSHIDIHEFSARLAMEIINSYIALYSGQYEIFKRRIKLEQEFDKFTKSILSLHDNTIFKDFFIRYYPQLQKMVLPDEFFKIVFEYYTNELSETIAGIQLDSEDIEMLRIHLLEDYHEIGQNPIECFKRNMNEIIFTKLILKNM